MNALRSRPVMGPYRLGELALIAALVLSACAPRDLDSNPSPTASAPPPAPTAGPAVASAPSVVPTPSAATGQSAVVVFLKDGDIIVWEEATGQSETIFSAGDVIAVTMSDDAQVVAFLRRSVVQKSEMEWYEQSALWAVDRNGQNPRELVSAEYLRGLLDASETDSTNIPQMEWIPRTHRLLYSAWTYFVQAEGESHATPAGLYLVDADTLTHAVLIPAGDHMRFAPSPDGGRVALMSLTGLSFVDVDGNNRSQEVLTYPGVGIGGSAFPAGVWTQDSRAFVITGSIEPEPRTSLDFTIWRVPVDGSAAQLLAAYSASHPDSVTFSPDGRQAAFFQGYPPEGVVTDYGWFVTPLWLMTWARWPLQDPRTSSGRTCTGPRLERPMPSVKGPCSSSALRPRRIPKFAAKCSTWVTGSPRSSGSTAPASST